MVNSPYGHMASRCFVLVQVGKAVLVRHERPR